MNDKVNIHGVISATATPAFEVSTKNFGIVYDVLYIFTLIMLWVGLEIHFGIL